MSEALDKRRVQEAFRAAAQSGKDIIRELDKVWAAINRGEYDVPAWGQTSDVHVVLAPVGDDTPNMQFVETEDAQGHGLGFPTHKDDKGMTHIVIPQFVQTPAVPEVVTHAHAVMEHSEEHDAATVFAADYILARHEGRPTPYMGQLPGAQPDNNAQLITDALQRWVAAQYPGHVVRDWAAGLNLILMEDDNMMDDQVGLAERTTYVTDPSGTLPAEIGVLTVALDVLRAHAHRVAMEDQ